MSYRTGYRAEESGRGALLQAITMGKQLNKVDLEKVEMAEVSQEYELHFLDGSIIILYQFQAEEKKPHYGEVAALLKRRCTGGGDDGDSDDDWSESEEWSDDGDDEIGFGLFDDLSEMKERSSFDAVNFESVDKEFEAVLPTPFQVEMKQPKISEEMLGSIFRAQQLVRRSLTVLGIYLT